MRCDVPEFASPLTARSCGASCTAGLDTPFPLVFEAAYLPGVARVVDAARQALEF